MQCEARSLESAQSPPAAVEAATDYDRVPYASYPHADTHPDRLCVIAGLHGMSAAPASDCRVLELGCGSGDNLLPMACELPDSAFVGVDLSRGAIGRGNVAIAQLDLSNIRLEHRSIMDIGPEDGHFDYIIAHGVFSWVPAPVREKILDIFRVNLRPHGVGYLSYNALPGAHLRDLARSIMLFHVRATEDPSRRAAQARLLMRSLAEASADNEVYGAVLRDQQHRISTLSDDVFIHDDLDAQSTPFFLYQVVEAAAKYSLQYLAEAGAQEQSERRSDDARRMLGQIPASKLVVKEQYADFISGRAFRKSLFCHHDVKLRQPPAAADIANYWIAFNAQAEGATPDLAEMAALDFKAFNGGRMSTNHPLGKAALLTLARVWPQAFAFDDLLARAAASLGASQVLKADREALLAILFEGYTSGFVRLNGAPPKTTADISDMPCASRLARWQARRQALVTNLLHELVHIEDDTSRRLLCLLDGTRDLNALIREFEPTGADGGKLNRAALEAALRGLARVALLVSTVEEPALPATLIQTGLQTESGVATTKD